LDILAELHEAWVHLLVRLAIYGLAVGRGGFSLRKLGKARKGRRRG
jgi:hypothetical protein